jgi:Fe2+ transport system protein FeoA
MKHSGVPRPLGDLAVGAQARLVGFDSLDERDLHRLVAFGLTPGVGLKVLQRVPAYILKIHETELVLEQSLANAIYVLSDSS